MGLFKLYDLGKRVKRIKSLLGGLLREEEIKRDVQELQEEPNKTKKNDKDPNITWIQGL
jgi:hypothetical protein